MWTGDFYPVFQTNTLFKPKINKQLVSQRYTLLWACALLTCVSFFGKNAGVMTQWKTTSHFIVTQLITSAITCFVTKANHKSIHTHAHAPTQTSAYDSCLTGILSVFNQISWSVSYLSSKCVMCVKVLLMTTLRKRKQCWCMHKHTCDLYFTFLTPSYPPLHS